MVWCCKTNFKTNSFRLETKKEELYTYTFKYVNYEGDYHADRYDCSFWKHRFNREWHTKKSQKLREIRAS